LLIIENARNHIDEKSLNLVSDFFISKNKW